MLGLPTILTAVHPKVILAGAAVWIGLSNAGPGTVKACVTSVGTQHGRGGEFSADMHACRSEDQFVALRPGDSYLFLHARTARRANKHLLNVLVSEGQGTPSSVKLEVSASTSTKLPPARRPDTKALTAVRTNDQIVVENKSDVPLAIAAGGNSCHDIDPSKMLLLGHNQIVLSARSAVEGRLVLFDPAKPCKEIGTTQIQRQ